MSLRQFPSEGRPLRFGQRNCLRGMALTVDRHTRSNFSTDRHIPLSANEYGTVYSEYYLSTAGRREAYSTQYSVRVYRYHTVMLLLLLAFLGHPSTRRLVGSLSYVIGRGRISK